MPPYEQLIDWTQGTPGKPLIADVYERQKQALAQNAIEESYNPLEDIAPVGTVRRLLGLGAMGMLPMLGRVGVLPGMERTASRLTREGLRGPWFHGSRAAEEILPANRSGPSTIEYLRTVLNNPQEASRLPSETVNRMWKDLHTLEAGGTIPPLGGGFHPQYIGSSTGIRLGEPAGISLTRDLGVARKFGTPLRVGVDVPPSAVGEFVDPEFQRLLREAYSQGMTKIGQTPVRTTGLGEMPFSSSITMSQKIPGADMFAEQSVPLIHELNQSMSDYLRKQGVEAIRYNPRRWNEFELRVLDPTKAVPLGQVDPHEIVPWRYYYGRALEPGGVFYPEKRAGAYSKLIKEMEAAPEYPVRLHDVLGVSAD